jgi:hypothetical protein
VSRHAPPLKIRHLAASLPAVYVVFDLLVESYQDIMGHRVPAEL